ncbi:MAG: hypothetical protein HRU36_00925 [Rickettsiales bacterium]|nr:hypothetical protein [Rickettsiales bacterium]
MTSLFFYNGTYAGDASVLQSLDTSETESKFGFKYIESDLTSVLQDCMLPEHINSYQVLNEPEKHIAIHKTCSNVDIGYGLVAISSIPANTIVFEYRGARVESVFDNGVYAIKSDNVAIDAKYQGNLARFSNYLPHFFPYSPPYSFLPDYPWLKSEPIQLANLELISAECLGEERFFLVTRESVTSGTELGWDYGPEYFKEHSLSYYINSKTGECFPKTKNLQSYLMPFEQLIEIYENTDLHIVNYTFTQLYIDALVTRGEAYSSLYDYNNAAYDYEKIFNTYPLSLSNKIKYLKLLEEVQYKLTIEFLYDEAGASCEEAIDDLIERFSELVNDDEDVTLQKIYEFFIPYQNDECTKGTYEKFIELSEKLLPYTQKSSGFCTSYDNDEVMISADSLFYQDWGVIITAMCHFENLCYGVCNPNDDILMGCETIRYV